jgi:hypothetical protein
VGDDGLPCHWVEPDLCSACADELAWIAALAYHVYVECNPEFTDLAARWDAEFALEESWRTT